MVNLTQLRLARLLDRKDNIRNIFIFAPSCQAKSYITDALVSAAGVIAPRVTADVTDMNDPSGAVKECGQSAHSDGDKQSSHTDGIVSDTAAGDESDALVSDTTATHDYTSGMAIAHSGVDKQSHSDGIVSDPAPGAVSDALVSDTHAANSEMAIYYEMTKHSLPCNGEARSNRFLLNLIDSPQILDSSTEFNADISIADGALIVVDCNEGVTVNMEAFLRQVLLESIIPVLSLDLMDERLLDSEEDDGYDIGGEQVYGNLLSIIKNANKIISSYENKLLPDVKFYPEKGNVAFSCCSSRWGFTLDDFANFWAPGLGVRHSDMLEKLWGDHFYDTKTKEWTRQHTGARTCHRGFVYFCYKTILHIKECCLKGDTKMLNRILGDVVSTEPDDKELVGNALVKHVMQAWLPAGTALLEMMILKLPSPLRAQRYRVEHLYQGPLNDVYANAIRTCDPGGPLMMYVYKVAPADEKGKLIAFGRIFSGTLQSGLKVHVMGPIVPGQKKKHVVKSFESSSVWIGKEQEQVETVPCGNIVTLVGLEQFVAANYTLANQKMLGVFPIRAISLAIANNKEIADVTLKAVVGSKQKDFSLPYAVYNTLYLHQREGLQWLWSSHCNKRGGAILADDMGLGKTRQVSSFLRGLLHSHIIKRAMVIAPSSVIDHWEPELLKVGLASRKFTHGRDENHLTGLKTIAAEGGVILTTYEMVRIHETKISNELRSIDYMFADEGHRIKNYDIKTAKALARINCKHRIVVTGTPVQNHIWEFYSLLSFCCPALLGSYKDFEANFIVPIDRGKYKDTDFGLIAKSIEASQRLREVVAPFILRRTKDLLKATGRLTSNKFEVTVWLKINPLQRKLYEALVHDDMLKKRGYALEASKIAKGICMHPCLVMPSGDGASSSAYKISELLKNNMMNHLKSLCPDLEPNNLTSSRLDFILYFVPKLIQDGHKILIFSMLPGMLTLIQRALQTILDEEKVICMDGTTHTNDRLKLIEKFQGENGPSVFLMTTRVGGFGITLTAATRVFIIDPSDNPMNDNQAVDRAYRIGQTKDVVVYRFITCGTIEEYTYRQQVVKIETACALLEGEQCQREIRKQEGLVLTVPTEGFDVSVTHNELVGIHGNVFDRSLDGEKKLIKKHESVFDIFNHSTTCSVKEDYMPYHTTEKEFQSRTQLLKGRCAEVKEIPEAGFMKAIVRVSRNIVPFLQGSGHHKVQNVACYSGAIVRILGATDPQFQEIILEGSHDEIREAKELIQKIIEETKVEVTHIKRDGAPFVRANIESIQRRSGAQVKLHDAAGDSSEQHVEIIGAAEEIEMAKNMVVRIATKKY